MWGAKRRTLKALLIVGLVVCAFVANVLAENKPAPVLPKPVKAASAKAAPTFSKVAVIPLAGMIDYGLSESMKRRVEEALAAGAEVLIFEMDTYGGGLGPGHEISDYINNLQREAKSKVYTVAYVEKKAISAGALISVACRQIVMRRGTQIGDCQAIQVNPKTQQMQVAPEKVQTLVRTLMRTYAQSNGYPELLCEAMVDASIEAVKVTLATKKKGGKDEVRYLTPAQVKGLSAEDTKRMKGKPVTVLASGKLLTMTDTEAEEYGFSRASVDRRADAVALYSAGKAQVVTYPITSVDQLVRFMNNPALSSLLIMIGLVAVYVAIKTPGFGVPEGVAIACFAVFFLSRYLADLAEYWEILLFILGVALLYIEVFVTPGFGFIGISGILCIFVSLLLSLQKFVVPTPDLPGSIGEFVNNLMAVLLSVVLSVGGFFVLLRFLPRSRFMSPLILNHTEALEAGYVVGSAGKQDLVGQSGTSVTPLRPAGKVEVDGQTLLVVSDGEFIEAGTRVVIEKVSGNRIVVTRSEAV